MSRLKVAFIPTNVSGVNFYRVWQFHNAFKKRHDVTSTVVLDRPEAEWYQDEQYLLHPWERDYMQGGEMGRTVMEDLVNVCKWADVVVWMSLHTPHSLELFKRLKTLSGKPFVTETDDNMYDVPDNNLAASHYFHGSDSARMFAEQCELSDGMVVSTPNLKTVYDQHNRNIHVVENAIDLALWRRLPPPPGRQGVTIGWVGGASHTLDLKMIERPLFKVLEENPHVRFVCLHGCPPDWRDRDRVVCPMAMVGPRYLPEFKPIRDYPEWVIKHRFDIGIAPLEDNLFNRAKSNLRWLEYSAMGIPTVASPLDHFTQSIEHKKHGYLADGDDDWYEYLTLLVRNEAERIRVGTNARHAVKQFWSPKLLGEKYMYVLKELANVGTYITTT
jgi:glycosyltransferase involved in cell wall biosynthesis